MFPLIQQLDTTSVIVKQYKSQQDWDLKQMILNFFCGIADDPQIAEMVSRLGAGQLMVNDLIKTTKGITISQDYIVTLLDCMGILASKEQYKDFLQKDCLQAISLILNSDRKMPKIKALKLIYYLSVEEEGRTIMNREDIFSQLTNIIISVHLSEEKEFIIFQNSIIAITNFANDAKYLMLLDYIDDQVPFYDSLISVYGGFRGAE